MARRFDGSNHSVWRTTDLPAWDACTLMAWAYISVDRAADSYIFQWCNASSTNGSYCGINSTRQLFVEENTNRTTGSTLAVGTWYHIAMATGPSNVTVYLNGVQDAQRASGTFTPAFLQWGGGTGFLNGNVSALKAFTVEMTATQITQEMRSVRPLGGSVHGFWPSILHTDLEDLSGTGRTLTLNGTQLTEDGPPVGWGATPYVIRNPAAGPGGRNPVSMGFDLR